MTKTASTPEPAPTTKILDFDKSVQHDAAFDCPPHVQRALRERADDGLEKYGTYLGAHNGRDALRDANQEALDLVVYLKQAELEKREGVSILFQKAVELADMLTTRINLESRAQELDIENDKFRDRLEIAEADLFRIRGGQ